MINLKCLRCCLNRHFNAQFNLPDFAKKFDKPILILRSCEGQKPICAKSIGLFSTSYDPRIKMRWSNILAKSYKIDLPQAYEYCLNYLA